MKVLLRPLQPHAVENLTEVVIHYFYSIPLPTNLVNQPEKEIWLVWHNLSSQIHNGCFPSPCYPLRVTGWLSTNLAEYLWGYQSLVRCSIIPQVVFLCVSKARHHALLSVSGYHISKFVHTWLIGTTCPGTARSTSSTQWVYGQSCR